jgi:hypothetical protein
MQSKATSVEQYLAELPPERRDALQVVRDVILKSVDKDIEEGMQYGMIGYYVPRRVFPAGYHCDPRQPLPYAGLASQKNHMALYLMSIYLHDGTRKTFEDAWKKTGKKLDMGASCIRFKKADDLALNVIGQTLRGVPARKYIEAYEAILQSRGSRKPASKAPATKAAGAQKAKPAGSKKLKARAR